MPDQTISPRAALAQAAPSRVVRRTVFAGLAFALAWFTPSAARAIDITELLPAGLDSPRVFARLLDPNGNVYSAPGNEFAFPVLLDTGASGVIISRLYQQELGVPLQGWPEPSGPPIVFEDVGVGGTDEFNVSRLVKIQLANNYEGADPDAPSSYIHEQNAMRLQVAMPTDNPFLQDLNIFGMPAMQNKVVVMDPTTVDFGGPNFQGQINTWLYDPGTSPNPGTPNTNPGIPAVDVRVKLTYGNFERFTQVVPNAASPVGPLLRDNPFIGPDPNESNPPPNSAPPVTISFGGESSQGSFLLDTGAAASIISRAKAEELNIRYRPGSEGTSDPKLETFDPLNPAAPGTLIPAELQYDLDITGFGGTVKRSGFYLDSLLLPTEAGRTDPSKNINYLGAPVLVSDITLQDPNTQETLTLDGIFGMNFLVASAVVEFPNFETVDGPFRWITFDEPSGYLGLKFKDTLPVTPNEWVRINGGIWANDDNWSGLVVPDSNTAVVLLGQDLLTNGAIDLQSADRTLRTLRFDNQVASYTVESTGPGRLVLEAVATGRATIQFDFSNGRDHTIASPLHLKSSADIYATANTLGLTGGVTWDDNVQVVVHTGIVRYALDATDAVNVGAGNRLYVDEGAAVELAGVKSPLSDGTQHVDVYVHPNGDLFVETGSHHVGSILNNGRTTVAPGAALIASNVAASELTLQGTGSHFTIRADSPIAKASVVSTLNVSPEATFDLNDNAIVVKATAATKDAKYNEIKNKIVTAQNGVDARFITKWDGPGITSSAARATNVNTGFDLVGLGAIRNSDLDVTTGLPGSAYATFVGEAVTPHDILARFTYIGDGNLDGVVSFDDYVGMDNAFFGLIPNLGWATGDINFDGTINFDDYSVVDQAFFFQGAPLASATAVTVVPEPATMVFLVVAIALASLTRMVRNEQRIVQARKLSHPVAQSTV